MALTGGLAANGKAALLAMQIWAEDVNKQGGLLGRQVELVYYDDQTKAAMVPALYTKLLDVDKVDFVVSGYGTNLIAPAMPIIIERGLVFMGLFGLAANEKFNYPYYFGIAPIGPNPRTDGSKGFFELARRQQLQTIALVGADAEFARNSLSGARENAKTYGFKVVYDTTYPPATTDFSPIVRAIKATNPRRRLCGLVSTRLSRHDAGRPRGRVGAEDVRRRHGGAAVCGVFVQAGAEVERHCEL